MSLSAVSRVVIVAEKAKSTAPGDEEASHIHICTYVSSQQREQGHTWSVICVGEINIFLNRGCLNICSVCVCVLVVVSPNPTLPRAFRSPPPFLGGGGGRGGVGGGERETHLGVFHSPVQLFSPAPGKPAPGIVSFSDVYVNKTFWSTFKNFFFLLYNKSSRCFFLWVLLGAQGEAGTT